MSGRGRDGYKWTIPSQICSTRVVILAAGNKMRRNNTLLTAVRQTKVGVEGIRRGMVLQTGTAWGICRMKLTNARWSRLAKSTRTHAHSAEGPMYCEPDGAHLLPVDLCRERSGGWLSLGPLRCASTTASPGNHRTTRTRTRLSQPRRSPRTPKDIRGRMAIEGHGQVPDVGVRWRPVSPFLEQM